MRASGYLVQWEEQRKRGWEKTRAYYPSKDDAQSSAEKLKRYRAEVRRLEIHPLYKR